MKLFVVEAIHLKYRSVLDCRPSFSMKLANSALFIRAEGDPHSSQNSSVIWSSSEQGVEEQEQAIP